MSGIKISFEAENLGVGSRPNSRKRRSSILKSPSRNALHDLDPNAEEVEESGQAKKKRRSSRRVSFANTCQVQEFLTANQLKILEDTITESETTQPVSTTENDADTATHTAPSSSVAFIHDAEETVPQQPDDISVGPGHCIRGLETLLSGPIKSHSTPDPEAKTSDPFHPRTYPQSREGTVQLPKIDETCEMQIKAEKGSTEIFDLENATAQDWPELTGTCNNLAVGLVGPSYHCTLPVPDSFNSSCQTSLSSSSSGGTSFPLPPCHDDITDSDINLNDTAVFELTLQREQFLAGLSEADDQVLGAPLEQPIEKKDVGSFLKSFLEMEPDDNTVFPPQLTTFSGFADAEHFENQMPTINSENIYTQSGDCLGEKENYGIPLKKKDTKSVLMSLFGSEDYAEETRVFSLDDTRADMDLTACIGMKATDGVCKKVDSSAFLKSMMQLDSTNPSDEPGHMTSPAKRDNVGGPLDEATSSMELTSFPKTEISGGLLKHQVVTVRFGDDRAGSMELTQCIGGLEGQLRQQRTSVPKHQHGSRPLKDITRIFSEQYEGEMDMTTTRTSCSVAIPDTQNEQTPIFIQDDTTSSMEMTTCLDGGAVFPKSSEETPSRYIPDGNEKQTGLEQDETQVFLAGDTGAQVEITTCFGDQETFKSERNGSTDPEIRPEKTRIFHSSDNTASMDITLCSDRQGNLARFSKTRSETGVSTKLQLTTEEMGISYDDTIAGMEMTSGMGGKKNPAILKEMTNANTHKKALSDDVEKTRIFCAKDVSGAMELTTCLGEKTGFTKLIKASSELKINQPKESVEVTRVFQFDDATAGMDMTECLGKVGLPEMASLQRPITGKFAVEKTFASDKTQIFGAGESHGMDLTTCVSGVFIEPENPRLKTSATEANKISIDQESSKGSKPQGSFSKYQEAALCTLPTMLPEDHTTHFTSDETAGMELTVGVGNLTSKALGTRQPPPKQIDDTHVFTSDETARVTSLNPFPLMVSPAVQMSKTTAVLDETTKMEMTACVGGIFSKKSADADQGKPAKQHGEHTTVFSNPEEADMDFTKCIDGPRPQTSYAVKTGSAEKDEHTKVFSSEDTANMEMTACVGDPLMKKHETTVIDSAKTVISGHTPANPKSHWCMIDQVTSSISHPLLSQDQTSNNIAAMEMTSCVGGLNVGGTQSTKDNSLGAVSGETIFSQTANFIPSDQTRVFDNEVSGKMELTSCIGGTENAKHVHDLNKYPSNPLPDSTRHFNQEETCRMELTRCVEVVTDPPMDLSSGHSSSSDEFRMSAAGSRDAEWMAPRSCNEMVIQATQEENLKLDGLANPQEENALKKQDQSSSRIVEDTGTTEPMDSISDPSQSAQDDNRPPLRVVSDKTAIEDTSMTQRRSETFTIEDAPVEEPIGGEDWKPSTRRSNTYTLEKPSGDSAAEVQFHEGDPTSATNGQPAASVDDDPVAANGLTRWGSVESTEGIDSEMPIWVENTEDFSKLSGGAVVAHCEMVKAMKEQSYSEIAQDLPTFAGDVVGETAASNALPSTDEKCQEAEEMLLSSNWNSQTDMGLLNVQVSFQEFLQLVTLNMPKGRRSVLPSVTQEASPQTVSDVLEDYFISQPKKELYEWGISHLLSLIKKMQDAVDEQEQRLNEDNLEIYKEIQRASPEKAAELQDQVLSLHKACSKMSRNSFQEWKLKMINNTHQAFKNAETEMTGILGSLNSSLDTLHNSLEELGEFQEELDAISQRQMKVEPPPDEQIREFLERQKQLADRQQEIQEIKTEKEVLESESLKLKSEIKECEKELADTVEKEWSLSNQTPSDDILQDAIVKLKDLQSLQKWRLRKHTQEDFIFTFLEETLVLTLSLGKDIENGEGVLKKPITDLSLKSLLADDASVGAHLAHNLIRAAVDVNTLHSNHPSTASLKLLLQEVSELVDVADGLAAETDKIRFRHVVMLNGTDLTVVFNNLDAMVRFFLTFKLHCGSYPFSPISTDFKHKVGQIKEKEVQQTLSEVKPGWAYLTRLVQSVDSLIQQHPVTGTQLGDH